MAEEAVDTEDHGRPVPPASDAEPDAGDLPAIDATGGHVLPDGRVVWSCPDGIFLDKNGYPDRSQPVDYQWPTVEEILAEADAAGR